MVRGGVFGRRGTAAHKNAYGRAGPRAGLAGFFAMGLALLVAGLTVTAARQGMASDGILPPRTLNAMPGAARPGLAPWVWTVTPKLDARSLLFFATVTTPEGRVYPALRAVPRVGLSAFDPGGPIKVTVTDEAGAVLLEQPFPGSEQPLGRESVPSNKTIQIHVDLRLFGDVQRLSWTVEPAAPAAQSASTAPETDMADAGPGAPARSGVRTPQPIEPGPAPEDDTVTARFEPPGARQPGVDAPTDAPRSITPAGEATMGDAPSVTMRIAPPDRTGPARGRQPSATAESTARQSGVPRSLAPARPGGESPSDRSTVPINPPPAKRALAEQSAPAQRPAPAPTAPPPPSFEDDAASPPRPLAAPDRTGRYASAQPAPSSPSRMEPAPVTRGAPDPVRPTLPARQDDDRWSSWTPDDPAPAGAPSSGAPLSLDPQQRREPRPQPAPSSGPAMSRSAAAAPPTARAPSPPTYEPEPSYRQPSAPAPRYAAPSDPLRSASRSPLSAPIPEAGAFSYGSVPRPLPAPGRAEPVQPYAAYRAAPVRGTTRDPGAVSRSPFVPATTPPPSRRPAEVAVPPAGSGRLAGPDEAAATIERLLSEGSDRGASTPQQVPPPQPRRAQTMDRAPASIAPGASIPPRAGAAPRPSVSQAPSLREPARPSIPTAATRPPRDRCEKIVYTYACGERPAFGARSDSILVTCNSSIASCCASREDRVKRLCGDDNYIESFNCGCP